MTACPVLAAFADVLATTAPPNSDAPERRRARAYALVGAALHTWAPKACRNAGREDVALRLEAVPLEVGEPSGGSDRLSAAHTAWEALGEAEYRVSIAVKGGPDWSNHEPTTSQGRTHAPTELERWQLWARRAATWALRADMRAEALALLEQEAVS